MVHSLIASVFLFMAVEAAGASSLHEVKLAFELVPDSTLPGIPVSFRFTFQNVSDHGVALPDSTFIEVRDLQGDVYLADGPRRHDEWGHTVLPAHGTIVREILTEGTMREPMLLPNGRTSRPGVFAYRAFAVVGPVHLDESVEDLHGHSVASNVATLTVREPHGTDAAVW